MIVKCLYDVVQFRTDMKLQFPCNLEFYSDNMDDVFKNPGIFYLFFRGELIYIGYSNNHQNIITERVVRQIATITLRDFRLNFTSAALDGLIGQNEMITYFRNPIPRVENSDFVTSVNRVLFASNHWDEFKNLNNQTLKLFELHWFPNPDLRVKSSISDLCDALKNKYKPRCNQEYVKPRIG
jgi:hypothetical protein